MPVLVPQVCLKTVLVFGVLLAPRACLAAPREEIESAYARSSLALQLKYLDGVASIRAPGYRLISSEGLNLDLDIERRRLGQLLAPVLRASESTSLLQFTPLSPERAKCRVRYVTVLVSMDQVTQRELRQTIVTECLDDWRLFGPRWLLVATRVVKQDVSR